MTGQTFHPIPVLPLEEVHHEAIVAHAVDLPLLLARDLRWQLLQFGFPFRCSLNLRLLQDTVQVLVQTV